ncbi:MAG: hypothetical protein K8U57_02030 [Planctomycetes bacterium]|nr:hypothetical protein [Planctomycetota bacterium]
MLKRLFPKSELVKDADVGETVFQVLNLWRRRLNVLKQAGWSMGEKKKYGYMRNCLPSSVVMEASRVVYKPRFCCVSLICPWCWMRETVNKTWNTVVGAMQANSSMFDKDQVGPYPYKLLVGTRNVSFEESDNQPAACLDRADRLLTQMRRRWSDNLVGAIYFGVVSPSKNGWTVSNRLLGLAHSDFKVPDTVKVIEHPTRRNVAAAVAKFSAYPVGMMRHDPERVIRLLDARSSYRLYRTVGVFRAGGRVVGDPEPEEGDRAIDLS